MSATPETESNTLTANGKKMGRPSIYSATLAAIICGRMAEGESVRSICRDKDMPDRSTVSRWASENAEFHSHYTRAEHLRVEVMSDECLEIADDGTTDFITKVGRNGVEYEAVDQEHIQRSRLRVDTRKWLMSKLKPEKYGERVEHEMSGTVTHTHTAQLGDREKMRRFALFMMEDQADGAMIEGESSEVPDLQASSPAKQP